MADYILTACTPVSTTAFDTDRRVDIEIRDGRIDRLVDAGEGDQSAFPEDRRFDAAGRIVTPTLVEPHTHLFAAMTAGKPMWNQSGTLEEGWRLWENHTRDMMDKADYKERARTLLRWFLANGITKVRTHLDVNSDDDAFVGVEALLEIQEEFRGLVDIQLVAFPISCLHTGEEALVDRFERALEMGVDMVGGIPHREHTREDGVRHVETVLDMAAKFDCRADLHIDETDDPQARFTEVLASETSKRGLGDRVTASHATALHSYSNAYADKLIRMIAESGMNVVTNPMSNAVLQGRYDDYPRRRGHTRIEELRDAGVTVGMGQDDIVDHFHGYGDGDPLKTAFVLVHYAHLNRPDDVPMLWDMLLNDNSTVYDGTESRLAEGEPGSVVVYDTSTSFDALRTQPNRPLVLRDGEPVVRSSSQTTIVDNGTEYDIDFER